jgi:hypothetical protein
VSDEPDEADALLLELRGLARSMTAEDRQPVLPPGSLWDRIAADALGGDPGLSSASPDPGTVAPVTALRPSRLRPRGTWVFALAAAVVAAAFIGVMTLAGGSDGDVVGATDLAALVDDGGTGSAQIVDEDGSLRLDLELADTPAVDDGYLEVWLIESVDPLRLVSLGPVNESGVYELPAGLDPAEYRVVDVSREHFDGEAAHSGDSILRGELQI